MKRAIYLGAAAILLAMLATACQGGDSAKVLAIAGIPDQNASTLARRYEVLTSYLSEELGVEVEYVPTVNYAAAVTGFEQGDIQMAWFGGLTGVQARLAAPGSRAIAQRPRDTEFHSKFIVQAEVTAEGLGDLKGLTFTFGSESSTSGHLMPRHFLRQAGVEPDADFNGPPSYSGSHDKTWKLVEGGAFQAGVLSEAVWDSAVEGGRVDLSKVRVLETTAPFFDYNWTIRGDLDDTFGNGFSDRLRDALLSIDGEQAEILELFSTDSFVASENGNYDSIREVAESLGIVK
ncbi:MAG: putative selenate ABC transporter substrate-binding protein [Chloroflexi bacterium]|nr:putative selenate ABC transporter substrate-binding protein [Chloroflexota bacterium]